MQRKEGHFANDFVERSGTMWRIVCNFEAEILNQYIHMRSLGSLENRADAKGRAEENCTHANDFGDTLQDFMCEK